MLRVPGEMLRRVPHPDWERRRVVDDDVERSSGERGDVAVQVADELFDASLEEVRACLVAVEQRDAMAARRGVLDLFRAGEARAAEDENVERADGAAGRIRRRTRSCGRLFSERDRRKSREADGAAGG